VGALTPVMRATAETPPSWSMSAEWFMGADFSDCELKAQAPAMFAMANLAP
jgi:hypothetical protein